MHGIRNISINRQGIILSQLDKFINQTKLKHRLLNDALNQYLQNQLASIRTSCGFDSSVHNQFYAHNTQMFRAHFKTHKRLLAFFLTKEIPTHERIAVRNICMRSTSCLGEIYS